jgi:ribosomal protein S18 acetylase RimI-like enzyme
MAQAYRIRIAQAGDAAQIARLSGELGHPVSDEEMGRRLALLLASSAEVVFVADSEDQQLLGWVAVTTRLALQVSAKAEITGLVVGAAARRMGVGRALVAASEDWAARGGFESLAVRSNIRRTESHLFYRSAGFSLHKTQHVYRKRAGTPGAG